MKLFASVKPNAKQESIAQLDGAHFAVSVKEPPAQGKANHAVMRVLAEYFRVPLSHVRLVSGLASRSKVFEINYINI